MNNTADSSLRAEQGPLRVERLFKEYATRHRREIVINNFSCHIGQRETVALIGPSGCGKSTLLNIIAGIDSADGGALSPAAESYTCGYAQQNDALLPWRTVVANCVLPLMLRGMRRAQANERALNILSSLQLTEYARHYPQQLSGGMRQRISLARALITKPRLLLLDEPFRSLDAITRSACYEWFHSMRETMRFTTLLVTHDPYEACQFSDRVLVCASPLSVRREFIVSNFARHELVDLIYRELHNSAEQSPNGGMGIRTPDLRHAKPSL